MEDTLCIWYNYHAIALMNLSPSQKKGFTFIELVVTIGVFALLSTLAVGNFRNTTKTLSLNSLANLVMSDIRRAQAKGISNQSYPGTNYIAPAVGVSFDSTYDTAYMMFLDVNDDKLNSSLGSSCSGECTERLVIKDGSTISHIKAKRTSGGVGAQLRELDSLHFTFQRPDPEPVIKGKENDNVTRDYYYAEIWLTSRDGLITKKIDVWKTGMIGML